MSRKNKLLLSGVAATLGVTALYHWPLGAGNEMEAKIENAARAELDRNEMVQVQAQLKNSPLSRTLILSGPADDFQRGELVRVMGEIPGVSAVQWDPGSPPLQRGAR